MKKVLFFAIALFSLNSNAQDLIIGENINNGTIANILTGEEISNTNCICVEINSKTSTIEITTFDVVQKYHIDRAEFNGDGYNDYFCSNNQGQKIEVSTSLYAISVLYDHYLLAFAEYPFYIQMENNEKFVKSPYYINEMGISK